jgi:hypothetical protein
VCKEYKINDIIKLMKNIIKKIIRFSLIPFVFLDYLKFKKKDLKPRFNYKLLDFYPCIKDKTIKTNFDHHYIYHTSWAARKVKEINSPKHTDISSSLYFSGIVSAFKPVDFYDYRPADLKLSDLNSGEIDLTKLSFADNSISSLSCMHTVEHIGLGRYGDEFDPDGDLKAISELERVLAKDGSLLFVVPIGKPKIEFNAHRIYSCEQIIKYFKKLTLREFSFITDTGAFIEKTDYKLVQDQDYACGCFWFIKQ